MLKKITRFISFLLLLTTYQVCEIHKMAYAASADLNPGESLPVSSKDPEIKIILNKVIAELPRSSRKLIDQGRLGITLVELEHNSKKRKWAEVNGGDSLCGASTLKIFCAMAAFQAEADGLVKISATEKTTLSRAKNISETVISIKDIKGSILYTKGPSEGNRQAGRVCAAVNDAYLRSESENVPRGKKATYQKCYTNQVLKNWKMDKEVALGKLFSSGRRCKVEGASKTPQGLWSLTTQRASSNSLSVLWTALELSEFSTLSQDRLKEIKSMLYGGVRVKGRLGKAFCKSEKNCYNKYGKTGTLTLKGLDLYCRNDSRVIEYPENKGKKIVLSVVCNNNYKNKVCKNDQVLESIARSVKKLMEERWNKKGTLMNQRESEPASR